MIEIHLASPWPVSAQTHQNLLSTEMWVRTFTRACCENVHLLRECYVNVSSDISIPVRDEKLGSEAK